MLLPLLILIRLVIVDARLLSRTIGKATLSFATRINATGMQNVVEKDRARAQVFKSTSHPSKRSTSVSITNSAVYYTARVGVGSPPTYYTLIVDTGSSNTWVGALWPYVPTSTSHDTGNAVYVSYGSYGNMTGEEWIDTVTLAPDLVINNQPIGVASSAYGPFSGVDGILAVGPADRTSGTVNNISMVPTVMDSLLTQGAIPEEVLGIYYVPASESCSTGTLTFGSYDESVITSQLKYVPLTTTYPASEFWGIDQSISYGETTILSLTSGIVDTGTTLILLASDAFERYKSATGGILDPATGLLTVTASQYADLQTLTFNIGGTPHDLSPDAQIWPRSLNSVIGGNSSAIYLVFGNLGTPSGSGVDFINGYTFLERYYSVFDKTNGQIGFAFTAYTRATTN